MQKGVEIRVRADARQAKKEIKSLEQNVASLEQTASKVTRGFKILATTIAATLTGAGLTKALTTATDKLTEMNNQIALVVGRGKELTGTFRELNSVAQRTRQPLSAVTTTFNRFGLALDGSGKSVDELLIATEAVQQAAQISGASAESAEAAIIQLGQGLGAGQLRGEELNSVLEQMPRLARAIAEGMGIPFGELRERAKDGQLEAEAVFNAIISQADKLGEEFQTIEATTKSLIVVIKDQFTEALSLIDREFGFSESLRKNLLAAIRGLNTFNGNFTAWVGNFKANTTLAINDAAFFVVGIREQLLEIFSPRGFDTKGFVDLLVKPFTLARDKIKEITQDENGEFKWKIPEIDLKSKIPSFEDIKGKLTALKDGVVGVFYEIWARIVGNSLWTGIFDPNHMESGQTLAVGSDLSDYFKAPLANLETFKNNIIAKFEDISKRATSAWEGIWKNLTTRTVMTPGGSESVDTTFGAAIKEFGNDVSSVIDGVIIEFENLKAYLNTNGYFGLKPFLAGTVQIIDNNSKSVIEGLRLALKAVSETPVFKTGELLISFFSTKAKNAKEAVEALNPDEFSNAFKQWFDDNGEKISAGISLGILAVMKLGFKKAFAGGAILTALGLGAGSILSDPTLQKSIENQAQGLTELAKAALTDDEGGQLLAGLAETLKSVGRGIAKGIFGEDFENAIVENIAAALAAITAAAVVSSTARSAVIAVGTSLATSLIGTSFVSKLKDGFTTGITNMMSGALLRTPVASGITAFGTSMGVAIAGAVIIGIGDAISNYLEESLTEDGSKSITDALALGAVEGAAVGGAFGLLFGPAGAIGGAIVGALVGSIVSAFNNSLPDLDLWFKDLGKKFYDTIFVEVPAAFTNAIDSIGDAFAEALKKGWKKATSFFGFGGTSNTAPGGALVESGGILVPSINNRKASGGYISGPGGPTEDKIPAMLSNGEYVIKASAVSKFGKGFLDKLNAGILPQFFNTGGLVSPYDGSIKNLQSDLRGLQEAGLTKRVSATQKTLDNLLARRAEWYAQQDTDYGSLGDGAASAAGADGAGGKGKGDKDTKTLGEQFALDFKNDFRSGFTEFLRTGDFESFAKGLVDSFTMKIIDSFSAGITEALFGENGLFGDFFDSIFDFGKNIGNTTLDATETGAKSIDIGGFFKGIGSFFKDIFGGLGSLFGGGGGGGLFAGIGSLFGFNSGGIVPATPYSQAGKDSVPAMLTPGELVVPANQVNKFMQNGIGGQQQSSVFNINVSGDISRQTRSEIVKMIPEITAGVNITNRENNYRGR